MVFPPLNPSAEQRQVYNAKRREQYHRQSEISRQRRRERERARYHALQSDAAKDRNSRRAKLERERYQRLTPEELEASDNVMALSSILFVPPSLTVVSSRDFRPRTARDANALLCLVKRRHRNALTVQFRVVTSPLHPSMMIMSKTQSPPSRSTLKQKLLLPLLKKGNRNLPSKVAEAQDMKWVGSGLEWRCWCVWATTTLDVKDKSTTTKT
jgi:hypothetical protein